MIEGMRISLATGLVLATSLGVVAGAALVAQGSTSQPLPGEYCSPKDAVYRSATTTLACAPSRSTTGHVDTAYRWRDLGVGCPAGYTRRDIAPLIPQQPKGEHILACAILPTVTPTPSGPSPSPSRSPAPLTLGG